MQTMNFKNKWVVVTGASSGIGLVMARMLARDHQANLVLVARRAETLEKIKIELEDQYNVHCQVIAADLSIESDVERVFTEATTQQQIYAVILNAGITFFGEHLELSWSSFKTLLATNVSSVVQLTNLFIPYLIAQNQSGGIMAVSSMVSLVPVPYQSAYAGSKAFVTNFFLSLQQELLKKPISLTLFAPGGIDTEMTQNSDLKYFQNTGALQTPEQCAESAIYSLQHRRNFHVPGAMNQAQLLLTRVTPRSVIASVTGMVYRKALKKS
ncbi:MAG: SDR family NAD(P)-dependent oxidoreductase [Gammaproteobacteria bacterium]|nr:SDR family NAD(P)-dependent oxidoreductase [Gammaproteobacteria bacterium]